ncbi:MAG: hypothetical protein K9J83_00770 [Desulfarculaceae bacterium]|nr:hypothetical protein [Desulfarculaceae bacterium]
MLICCLVAQPCLMQANEEIRHYYVRYDIKSSGNRLVDSNLTMVPAENEFRAENFSPVAAKGVISAVPGSSPETTVDRLTLLAKRDALKRLLRDKGLKSVTSRDSDTVVSYEGAVKTPVKLVTRQYNKETGRFEASFQVVFSPTAFPDRWDELEFKDRVKQLFSDFLIFFTN